MYKRSIDLFNSKIPYIITDIQLKDDKLKFTFNDDSSISIFDAGQSCCETRYMVCDDDLSRFIGASLVKIEVRDAPSVEEAYEVHEVQFLDIQTTKGLIQCATHNEHNGYYGGFSLEVV